MMNAALRRDLLRLFDACVAQIRSGKPGPSILTTREFEATLMHLSERLKAESGAPSERSSSESVVIELIVKADVADAGDRMGDLRRWLRGAREVVLCDPYLLQFEPSALYPDVASYADAVVRLFPTTAKQVHLYTNSYNRAVYPAVFRPLKEGREVRHIMSTGLHDRFIIKDRSEGKSIGTSFGGFGRKFFAMTDLTPGDVAAVLLELRALCPDPVRQGPRRRKASE